jgi:tetratricopeptide (TPR) repeat protein
MALACGAFAQSVKTVHFPRRGAGVGAGDRTIRVWLPRAYSRANRYPVLFTFGAQGAELIAHVAAYYEDAMHQIPPVIVVGIEADVDEIGFSYESGTVNEAGRRFTDYLSGEMMPYLEKTYSLARFRAFIGHSYGATYTDYLLKEHPTWFRGCALIAPEKPAYKLEYRPLLARLLSPFYYYLAAGQLDMDRRQEHAGSIATQLKSGNRIHFKYDLLADADHLTTIPRAVPAALEFLFSGYHELEYRDSDGDLSAWFQVLERRIRDLYGFGIRVDSSNAAYFCSLAVQKKDLKALKTFETYFVSGRSEASVLFNTAQYYCSLGEFAKGEQLFRRAIATSKKTRRPDFLLMSHRTIALRLYSDHEQNASKAWKALEEGFADCRDVAFKYYFGLISSRHGYRLDDGIRYLREFETERAQSFFGTLYPLDGVYVLLAKCYLQKGDKAEAKAYAEKALKANPANEEAAALKAKLSPL